MQYRLAKNLAIETVYCSDWGISPNGTEYNLYTGDPFEQGHEEAYLKVRTPDYLAVYEWPKKETDLPIHLTIAGPST